MGLRAMAFITITEVPVGVAVCDFFRQMSKLEQSLGNGQTEAAVSSLPNTKAMRVLLIEDEPLTRLVLLQKLRTAGLEVDFAPNGRIALEKLRSGRPDAIFMDLLLPYVKGEGVIKQARREPVFADRPIYVCTSAALMDAWTRRGIKAGATKVFNKASTPIDQIIAEVAADLLSHGPAADAPVALPPDQAEPEPLNESSAKLDGDIFSSDLAPEPATPEQEKEAHAPKTPSKPSGFMQRALKTLGLARTTQAPSEPAAPADPVPIPAAQDPDGPSADTAIWFRVGPKSKPENPAAEEPATPAGRMNSIPISPDIGILQIDKERKIVSASDLCAAIFSWEGPELIGQDFGVLLDGGLDNEVGRFLQRTEAAEQSSERSSFSVTARKKDGAEFPASVVLTRRSADSRFCWTAIFRVSTSGADASIQTPIAAIQDSRAAEAQPADVAMIQFQPQESQVAAASDHEEVQKQFQAVSAEAARHRESLAKSQTEHDELVGRISSHELELNRAQTALERELQERKQLQQTLEQLTRAKTELEQQLAEQRRSQEELEKSAGQLRDQLNEAKAAADRAEAAFRQEGGRANRFEEDLANLRKGYDELNGKLAAEQQAAAESRRRSEELENRLRENATELERVKAELAKHAEERGRLESEWREQLDTANALTKKMETAWLEEAGRNKAFEERLRILSRSLKLEQAERTKRFEVEVAGLGQERDELNGKLLAEQQAAAESKLRADALESHLRDSAEEVEAAKAKLETQAAEQKRLESEWREQLNTAEALTKKLEAAWLEADARNKRFEQELAGLRQVRDDLNGKLTAEQQAAAESKRRVEELESRLRENTAELERVKADRSEHFEQQLTSLQQVRDELSGELKSEQQATAQSRQRSDDLENRLRENTAELERIKTDRDKTAEQQASLESELRGQLDTAKAAAERADAALRQQAAQCRQVEHDLVSLRQARDELNGKLTAEQQAAVQSRQRGEELENRLRESAAELERFKAERDHHAAEQACLELQLRGQLDAAKAAAGRAEAALEEEAARNGGFEERLRIFGNSLRQEEAQRNQRFEEELVALRQTRGDLSGKLTAEQQETAESRRRTEELEQRLRENAGELERVKAELHEQAGERSGLESQLRAQLDAAKAGAAEAKAAIKEAIAQSKRSAKRFENELANLRQERHQVYDKFIAEQQAGAKSKRRVKELEKSLRETAASFATFKTELDSRVAERARLESESGAELEAAKGAAQRADAAHKEETARCSRLEQELADLRRKREELCARLAAEQKMVAESRHRVEELESRLRESAAELERAKADLESEAADPGEVAELKARVHDGVASQARLTAELEKQRGERRRTERRAGSLSAKLEKLHADLSQHLESERAAHTRISELEQQLREKEEAVVRASAQLQQETADRQLAEEQLRAVGDMSAQWRQYLSLFDESKQAFKRAQADLEARLQTNLDSLSECESKLQQEAGERQRLEETLAAAKRHAHDQSQRSAVELSKLQSALLVEQFERKRLEGEAIQSRYCSLDSARVGRTTVNRLRRQIRQPLDSLVQSTRRLLEVQLDEEQTKLVEAVLENALVLQSSLQEAGTANGNSPRAEGEGQLDK